MTPALSVGLFRESSKRAAGSSNNSISFFSASDISLSDHQLAIAEQNGCCSTCCCPSVVKEILIGVTLDLMAGGLWKMHHWNNQKRTREFYNMLDKGVISVVVEDE